MWQSNKGQMRSLFILRLEVFDKINTLHPRGFGSLKIFMQIHK